MPQKWFQLSIWTKGTKKIGLIQTKYRAVYISAVIGIAQSRRIGVKNMGGVNITKHVHT